MRLHRAFIIYPLRPHPTGGIELVVTLSLEGLLQRNLLFFSLGESFPL
jgi:hypothetical protein